MGKNMLKSCLVISPIGEEETEVRQRSNKVLKHIIEPVAYECGYQAIRADKISEPGIITSQIIGRLLNDDLVIADLTGMNANVYYELAVRHAIKKAVVQIIHQGDKIPFDVSMTRTISFDYRDLDSVAYCKEELKKQIENVEKDPSKVDSPISAAIDLQTLSRSDNILEKTNAEIINLLQDIKSSMGRLKYISPPTWMSTYGKTWPYDKGPVEKVYNSDIEPKKQTYESGKDNDKTRYYKNDDPLRE